MGILPNPDTRRGEYHWSTAPPGAPPVIVAPGSGRYAGPVTVQLTAPVPGSTVYYTLDGADPTVGGQEYTAPLAVRRRRCCGRWRCARACR